MMAKRIDGVVYNIIAAEAELRSLSFSSSDQKSMQSISSTAFNYIDVDAGTLSLARRSAVIELLIGAQ